MTSTPRQTATAASRRSLRRGRLALAVFGWMTLLALLAPATASAHATLLRSDPEIGGTYAESPEAITLWLSEPVEARYSRVELLDSSGKALKTGALADVPNSPDPALRLPLNGKLSDGSYTVVWSSLSQVDGHIVNGFFSFAIGNASLPTDAVQAALVRQATANRSVPLAVEAGFRWLGLLGQATLAGALCFVPLVLTPALGRAPLRARRYRRLLGVALVAVLVALLAAAVLQTMNATRSSFLDAFGRPLLTLLANTRFGAIWLARGALLLALAVLVWTLTRHERLVTTRGRGRLAWAAGILSSGLLLLTTSLNSHAAALGGGASFNTLNDWLHLAGTSLWLGGLAALLVMLPTAQQSGDAARVVTRFSALAIGAVALLVVTGVLAARWQLVSWDGLTGTRYGAWLLLKLTLVAAMLGFGAWHLLVARPQLAAGMATAPSGFRRSLRGEVAVATLVLVVTAVLTISVPARDLLGQGTSVFATTRLTTEASVTLRATPGKVGVNQFSLVVAPLDLATFGTVQRVYLSFEPVLADGAQPGAAQRVLLGDAGPDQPNTWSGSGAYLALNGDWSVTAIVRRDGVRDLEVPFALTAGSGGLRPVGVAPATDGARNRTALLLGLVWLAAALGLGGAGWRLRRERVSLAYGLFALAVVALAFGSLVLAASQAAPR